MSSVLTFDWMTLIREAFYTRIGLARATEIGPYDLLKALIQFTAYLCHLSSRHSSRPLERGSFLSLSHHFSHPMLSLVPGLRLDLLPASVWENKPSAGGNRTYASIWPVTGKGFQNTE